VLSISSDLLDAVASLGVVIGTGILWSRSWSAPAPGAVGPGLGHCESSRRASAWAVLGVTFNRPGFRVEVAPPYWRLPPAWWAARERQV
jgi:hypothetical protein